MSNNTIDECYPPPIGRGQILRNQFYYNFKPLIPARVRRGVRRWLARRSLPHLRRIWPVFPGSERPPVGWPGWPEGKRFAFVLSHDVESAAGLEKCRALMKLESQWGFRSAFNLIPEGEYRATREFREALVEGGWEVGVHDLHHDGRLYSSRRGFVQKAARINHYLRDWGAVGFRSAYMFHNLQWLKELNVAYDASTFDTDPFEPQSDGVGTIFPFWVPREEGVGRGGAWPGYVELPYTLPQDHTLFVILRERQPDIWLEKTGLDCPAWRHGFG
jgi:hypothetical protein